MAGPGPVSSIDIERIEGVTVMPWTGEVRTSIVHVSYRDAQDRWYELNMKMGDALYLLNHLERISQDLGTEKFRGKS